MILTKEEAKYFDSVFDEVNKQLRQTAKYLESDEAKKLYNAKQDEINSIFDQLRSESTAFDFDDFINNYDYSSAKKLIEEFYKKGKKQAVEDLKVKDIKEALDYTEADSEALYFLNKYNFELIRDVNEQTVRGIRTTIFDSVSGGDTPQETVKKLKLLPIAPLPIYKKDNKGNVLFEVDDDGNAVYDENGDPIPQVVRVISVRARCEMIARTEVARAKSNGSVQTYANYGVEEVDWNTVNDAMVCFICARYQAENPHKIENMQGMCPAHPNCRCNISAHLNLDDDIAKMKNPKLVSLVPKKKVKEYGKEKKTSKDGFEWEVFSTGDEKHTIEVRQTEDAGEFVKYLEEAYKTQPDSAKWRVTLEPASFYENKNYKMFITKNGSVLCVTDTGDIISVCGHINEDGTHDNNGTLLLYAVSQGGNKLDSFDGNYGFYRHMGFEPVSWCFFDDRFKPDAWSDEYEREPIIFFRYVGKDSVDSIPDSASDFYSMIAPNSDYGSAEESREHYMANNGEYMDARDYYVSQNKDFTKEEQKRYDYLRNLESNQLIFFDKEELQYLQFKKAYANMKKAYDKGNLDNTRKLQFEFLDKALFDKNSKEFAEFNKFAINGDLIQLGRNILEKVKDGVPFSSAEERTFTWLSVLSALDRAYKQQMVKGEVEYTEYVDAMRAFNVLPQFDSDLYRVFDSDYSDAIISYTNLEAKTTKSLVGGKEFVEFLDNHKEHNEWLSNRYKDNLLNSEIESLRRWTSSMSEGKIKDYFFYGSKEGKADAENILRAFEKTDGLGDDMTLFRGISDSKHKEEMDNWFGKLKKGDIIDFTGFQSFTSDRTKAEGYAYASDSDERSIIFRLFAKNGDKILPIDFASHYADEYEYLVNHASQAKVLNVSDYKDRNRNTELVDIILTSDGSGNAPSKYVEGHPDLNAPYKPIVSADGFVYPSRYDDLSEEFYKTLLTYIDKYGDESKEKGFFLNKNTGEKAGKVVTGNEGQVNPEKGLKKYTGDTENIVGIHTHPKTGYTALSGSDFFYYLTDGTTVNSKNNCIGLAVSKNETWILRWDKKNYGTEVGLKIDQMVGRVFDKYDAEFNNRLDKEYESLSFEQRLEEANKRGYDDSLTDSQKIDRWYLDLYTEIATDIENKISRDILDLNNSKEFIENGVFVEQLKNSDIRKAVNREVELQKKEPEPTVYKKTDDVTIYETEKDYVKVAERNNEQYQLCLLNEFSEDAWTDNDPYKRECLQYNFNKTAKEMLYKYCVGFGTSYINQYLRGESQQGKENALAIRNLINTYAHLSENKVLFRGVAGDFGSMIFNQAKEGMYVNLHGITSVSESNNIAKTFANVNYKDGAVVFRIWGKKGEKFLATGGNGFNIAQDQREYLLDHGTQFKILKVSEAKNLDSEGKRKYKIVDVEVNDEVNSKTVPPLKYKGIPGSDFFTDPLQLSKDQIEEYVDDYNDKSNYIAFERKIYEENGTDDLILAEMEHTKDSYKEVSNDLMLSYQTSHIVEYQNILRGKGAWKFYLDSSYPYQDEITTLESAIENSKGASKDLITYHAFGGDYGEKLYDSLKVGDVITNEGFLSSSPDRGYAETYLRAFMATGDKPVKTVMLRIFTDEGTKILPIGIEGGDVNLEMLFNHKSQFEVTNIHDYELMYSDKLPKGSKVKMVDVKVLNQGKTTDEGFLKGLYNVRDWKDDRNHYDGFADYTDSEMVWRTTIKGQEVEPANYRNSPMAYYENINNTPTYEDFSQILDLIRADEPLDDYDKGIVGIVEQKFINEYMAGIGDPNRKDVDGVPIEEAKEAAIKLLDSQKGLVEDTWLYRTAGGSSIASMGEVGDTGKLNWITSVSFNKDYPIRWNHNATYIAFKAHKGVKGMSTTKLWGTNEAEMRLSPNTYYKITDSYKKGEIDVDGIFEPKGEKFKRDYLIVELSDKPFEDNVKLISETENKREYKLDNEVYTETTSDDSILDSHISDWLDFEENADIESIPYIRQFYDYSTRKNIDKWLETGNKEYEGYKEIADAVRYSIQNAKPLGTPRVFFKGISGEEGGKLFEKDFKNGDEIELSKIEQITNKYTRELMNTTVDQEAFDNVKGGVLFRIFADSESKLGVMDASYFDDLTYLVDKGTKLKVVGVSDVIDQKETDTDEGTIFSGKFKIVDVKIVEQPSDNLKKPKKLSLGSRENKLPINSLSDDSDEIEYVKEKYANPLVNNGKLYSRLKQNRTYLNDYEKRLLTFFDLAEQLEELAGFLDTNLELTNGQWDEFIAYQEELGTRAIEKFPDMDKYLMDSHDWKKFVELEQKKQKSKLTKRELKKFNELSELKSLNDLHNLSVVKELTKKEYKEYKKLSEKYKHKFKDSDDKGKNDGSKTEIMARKHKYKEDVRTEPIEIKTNEAVKELCEKLNYDIDFAVGEDNEDFLKITDKENDVELYVNGDIFYEGDWSNNTLIKDLLQTYFRSPQILKEVTQKIVLRQPIAGFDGTNVVGFVRRDSPYVRILESAIDAPQFALHHEMGHLLDYAYGDEFKVDTKEMDGNGDWKVTGQETYQGFGISNTKWYKDVVEADKRETGVEYASCYAESFAKENLGGMSEDFAESVKMVSAYRCGLDNIRISTPGFGGYLNPTEWKKKYPNRFDFVNSILDGDFDQRKSSFHVMPNVEGLIR